MGSYGKIEISEYAHTRWTPKRVEGFERAVSAWLDTKPGSFSSPDAVGLYVRAFAQFSQWSSRSDDRDTFEIALARCGFRAGVVVYDGNPKWLLILPSSVDGALNRLAAMER